MTRIARVVAEDIDDSNQKIVLLCGIDVDHYLVEGEWMGYWTDKKRRFPFVMTATSLEYHGHAELHNFSKRPIVPSELFTVAEQGETDGAVYRVRSVKDYFSS